MSLELDPVELGFRRPFSREVEEKLTLRNTSSGPVAFKVKTTAPKEYCVRPNSGRIDAGESVEVSVLLQAKKEEPPLDAKCRDKFLVQSVPLPKEDASTSVSLVWENLEKSAIHEKKIRVNFLPESSSISTPAKPSSSTYDDQPPAYNSPISAVATPAGKSVGPSSTDTSTEQKPMSTVVSEKAAAVTQAVPTSSEDLKAQLADAQRKIKSLSTSASTKLQQQQPPSGVSVPIVATMCLISFLLAYFLF